MKSRLEYEIDEQAMTTARSAAAIARKAGLCSERHIEIAIRGPISEQTTELVRSALNAAPYAESFDLMVDSQGGCFASAYDAFIEIARHPAERKTAYIRRAMSGAIFIALACDRRIARSGAEVLVHRSAYDFEPQERLTAERLQETADFLTWLDGQMVDIIIYRTGVGRSAVEAEMQSEEITPLDRAMVLGLVHAVWEELAEEAA